MTDPKDAGQAAEGRVTKRRRASIYGERRIVSLRMSPELHERMMGLCNELTIPANTYLTGLVEADLKKRRK